MDKGKSKYHNTALLMNQALIILLEKKDLGYITIKEICSKAGVNRSTFYLHYENINDLFNETIENLNKDFLISFKSEDKTNTSPDDLVFIKKEFIVPYLEFVKKHRKVMKIAHSKPLLFNNEKIYNNIKKEICVPAVTKHNVPKNEQNYLIEFYTRGVSAIVNLWLNNECIDPIDNIVNIILKCVGLWYVIYYSF